MNGRWKVLVGFCAVAVLPVIVFSLSWGKETNKTSGQKETARKIDPRSDSLLKAMSTYLASLNHFSLSTQRTVEVVLLSKQKIQYTNSGRVYIRRPDRLRADFIGDPMSPHWIILDSTRCPRDVSLYYNGDTLTVIERNRNEYASAAVPATIDSMIEYAWNCLEIEAPAADLIFQNSYSGLMDGVTAGTYLGIADIDSTPCHHLAFRKSDVDWQIWIASGGAPLPRKYMITSIKETGSPDFDVRLSRWDVSTKPSDDLFRFIPPSQAKKTELKTRKCKETSK